MVGALRASRQCAQGIKVQTDKELHYNCVLNKGHRGTHQIHLEKELLIIQQLLTYGHGREIFKMCCKLTPDKWEAKISKCSKLLNLIPTQTYHWGELELIEKLLLFNYYPEIYVKHGLSHEEYNKKLDKIMEILNF